MLTVADKAVDLVSKVNAIVTKKLDAHYQSVAQRPEDLVKGSATAAIKKGLAKGKRVTFRQLRGFKGIEEFEPSGWVYEESNAGRSPQPDGEMQHANAYPMGAGYMMMSGCFGSNYQKGDPCFKALRFVTRCANQIDSANFIGVGFDITKSYSSESRKKSVVQRVCQNKATFLGQDIPDNMNAFGIYDYSIGTRSFQSAYQYRQYLATKAGTEMSSGVFTQVSADFQKTQSVGSSGLFHDVGTARGSGWSSTAKSGVKLTSSLRRQMAKQGAGSSNSFLAVLEADLKLYEIALDHSTPEDLSAPFLNDFMRLPTSYYLIGADIKLQDFILRYGTHYVKSAKFGGKLNIFKSSKRNSKMTQDEFAASAETEFSAMMSTLHSSFSQTQTKVNYFGTGGQSGTKSRKGSATEINTSKNSKTSTQSGNQAYARSEFIETTVDAMGGDPEIAAAIMDFYSPAFKGLFIKWLSTIRDYPKPYDMTFGKIPELLDVSADSLFKVGKAASGCFSDNLKKDANGKYFIQNKTMSDGQNRTIITLQKIYCKYGKDKAKFMDDFKARRLALERAVTIYIAEGQFSVSSFELKPGNKGCETETIRYLSEGLTQSQTWPKWNDMKKVSFKVLFQLPFDLPMLKRDVEFEVKYNDGLWFTAMPGEAFTVDNSCPSAPGLRSKNRVCVVGMNLVYSEKHGYFTFDKEFYKREATYAANITKLVGSRFVARAELGNILKQLTKNTIGEVPCNVKWSNSHRIDPQQTTSCIHFSAASKGDIFVIFSSIPKDYSTWFYLQLSPSGIAFYRAMKLEKIDNVRSSGTLGEAALFETFFVCITQEKGKNLKILYGKAPAQREVGLVHAAFTYPLSDKDTVSFYTFGAGEEKISIDDVRVIQDKPKMSCGEGYIEVNGSCDLICHRECNGCHQAQDPRSCIACKNAKHFYTKGKFECLSVCPPGYELVGDVCSICKAGHYKASAGNRKCTQCSAGSYQDSEGKLKCKPCPIGHYQKDTGKNSCAKCGKGYYQGSGGQRKCLQCAKGFYQVKEGQKACSECGEGHRCPRKGSAQQLKCPANTYNGRTRQTACTPCANGKSSAAGSASCDNACNVGQYLKVKFGCRSCPSGQVAPVRGMARCKKCPVGEIPNKQRSKCQGITIY